MLDFEEREARVMQRESNRLSAAEGRKVDWLGFAESAGHKRYAMRAELVDVVGNERSYARLTASDGSYVLAEIPRGTTIGGVMEMIQAAFHRVEESRAGEASAFNAYDAPSEGYRRAATIFDCAAAIEKLTEYFTHDRQLSESAEMVCALAAAELGPVTMLECLWADVMLREEIIDQCRSECEPWQRGDRMVIDIGAVRRRVFDRIRERDSR